MCWCPSIRYLYDWFCVSSPPSLPPSFYTYPSLPPSAHSPPSLCTFPSLPPRSSWVCHTPCWPVGCGRWWRTLSQSTSWGQLTDCELERFECGVELKCGVPLRWMDGITLSHSQTHHLHSLLSLSPLLTLLSPSPASTPLLSSPPPPPLSPTPSHSSPSPLSSHPPPPLPSPPSMQAIQNLGLAVVAIVAGKIVDTKGYLVYEVFNCALLCCESHWPHRELPGGGASMCVWAA